MIAVVESSNLGEVAILRIATSPRFELSTTALAAPQPLALAVPGCMNWAIVVVYFQISFWFHSAWNRLHQWRLGLWATRCRGAFCYHGIRGNSLAILTPIYVSIDDFRREYLKKRKESKHKNWHTHCSIDLQQTGIKFTFRLLALLEI